MVNPETPFTRACARAERLSLPVKHGAGRFYAPFEVLDAMDANGQIVLRYAEGQNPNGSARDAAGVTNEEGNVLGLMPHPEHATDPLTGSVDGGRLFASVVEHVGGRTLTAAA